MKRINRFIEKHRFKLLLIFTLSFLIFPAYIPNGRFLRMVTLLTITFVFFQCIFIVANRRRQWRWIYLIFFALVFLSWFQPLLKDNHYLELLRVVLVFFIFVLTIISMLHYIIKAEKVTSDVLIVSVVIYLLIGIFGGTLAMFLNAVYPGSYQFAHEDVHVSMVTMVYYAFITMTTVGYGDITPTMAETQTFGYLLALIGQFYIAMLVAFIMGKFLAHQETSPGKE